jgi:hypothetical protein
MPYQVYEAAYNKVPQISMDLTERFKQRSASFIARKSVARFKKLWFFYLGLPLTVPLLMLLRRRGRWTHFALLTCGLLMIVFLIETWVLPHYAAPITGLIFVLALQGMRYLRLCQYHGRPTGRFIVRAILAILFVSIMFTRLLQLQSVLDDWYQEPKSWNFHRARILAQLREEEGNHLAIVRYEPEHSVHAEWVYNKADIDGAKVVWARELDADQNLKLLQYFKGRRVWLVETDAKPPRLLPY